MSHEEISLDRSGENDSNIASQITASISNIAHACKCCCAAPLPTLLASHPRLIHLAKATFLPNNHPQTLAHSASIASYSISQGLRHQAHRTKGYKEGGIGQPHLTIKDYSRSSTQMHLIQVNFVRFTIGACFFFDTLEGSNWNFSFPRVHSYI